MAEVRADDLKDQPFLDFFLYCIVLSDPCCLPQESLVGCKFCCCFVDSAAVVASSVDPAADVDAVSVTVFVSAVTVGSEAVIFQQALS